MLVPQFDSVVTCMHEESVTLLRFNPNEVARNFTRARLAFPSTGGAAIFTLRQSPDQPRISFFRARGLTRTLSKKEGLDGDMIRV